MSKVRVVLLLVASTAMLVWALPAMAHSAGGTTVKVVAGKPSEFHFKLSVMSVKTGAVTFAFTDDGALGHSFYVCSKPTMSDSADSCAGKGTPVIQPHKSATLKLTFSKAGNYEYLCTVPGHAAAGMKGLLKVT